MLEQMQLTAIALIPLVMLGSRGSEHHIIKMSWINNFKKQPSGISDLAVSIVDISYKCGQEFKESIDEKFGKDSKEAMTSWVQVQYEFLFFYTHLVMRSALSKLGNDKRIKLQDLLGPILVNFIHNLNVAEMDYSECKGGLLVKDQPFSENGLFSRLAMNIARLSGHENNPATILKCITIGVDKFAEMKLNLLIDAVGKEI
jgi:hypothetical protein